MRGLKQKILTLTLVPLFCILFILSGITVYNKDSSEQQLLLQRLNTYRSLLESGDLSFDSSQDKTKLEAILNEKVEFTEIISQDNSVLYSTENIATPLITNTQDKKDLIDAFNGIETIKNVSHNGKSALVIISPLEVDKRVVAVLHQGLSSELSDQRVRLYALYIYLLTGAGMVICYLLISLLLERAILRNLRHLKQATIAMQQGNYISPVAVQSNDEIGDFADVFEKMRSQVNTSKIHLEDQVKARTTELESKLDELARMNKLMVDRELKMVELKKEIEELKKHA
jgi:HAMP domain-containing protein